MKIVLSNNTSKFLETASELTILPTKYRLLISFKKFIFFFLLALGTLFIPVLHFILVPLFLCVSVFMAVQTYKVKYKLYIENSTICLDCNVQLFKFYLLTDELKFKCASCGTQYLIYK